MRRAAAGVRLGVSGRRTEAAIHQRRDAGAISSAGPRPRHRAFIIRVSNEGDFFETIDEPQDELE